MIARLSTRHPLFVTAALFAAACQAGSGTGGTSGSGGGRAGSSAGTGGQGGAAGSTPPTCSGTIPANATYTKTLTIGARTGSYTGMPTTRTFNIVFVGANHGGGVDVTATPDQVVKYDGTQAVATAK